MTPTPFTGPNWSTAALGNGDDHPLETAALGEHLQHCSGATGRAFAMRCGAEALQAFMLARLVTTALAALSLSLGLLWLVL